MAKRKSKINVVQDEQNPLPPDLIAAAIVDIGDAMEKLSKGPLKREAVIVLIKDRTGIPKATVTRVLDALEGLKEDWLK